MGAIYVEADANRRRTAARVIVAVALALVAAIWVLGHLWFRATERAALDEFRRRQLVLAEGATHGIELYFDTLTALLKPLAQAPEVQRLEEAPTRRFLALKAAELAPFDVGDVGVIDATGILRYSANDSPMEGTDFSSRRYHQEAKDAASGDARVVEFVEFEGTEPGRKGLLVGVPMFAGAAPEEGAEAPPARFLGLLACLVKLDFLAREFVAPIKPSSGAHAFLVDSDGNVLWSPDRALLGKNLLEDGAGCPHFPIIAERMLSGKPGTMNCCYATYDEATGTYAADREDTLIAYAPVRVGAKPWGLGILAPRADALALIGSAHLAQHLVVGFSTLVIVAGAGFALMMCSRIRRLLKAEVAAKTKELAQSHQRLLRVLDGLDAIVYVADLETHEILFANRRVRELFGNVVGRPCWEVLQAGQPEPCESCTDDLLVGPDGRPTGVQVSEFENTANGRWYEIHDRAIPWQDGRTVRLEIAVDITERRRQEQQIVEQNRQLEEKQQVIEGSRRELSAAAAKVSELIDTAARDQSLDATFSNPGLVACWKVRSCTNTWCPCHGREPMRCWQTEGTYCDRQSRSSFPEKVIRCRSCEVFRASCPNRLAELAEGFNNMTFLLSRKAEELRQLRFHALQRERMATIGQMAAGIAHEIDNPIASLFSLVQLLKASTPDEEAKARFALMQQCIDRISRIVREVVDFGRPIGSEDWVHGDVEKLLVDTLKLLRYDRRARRVEMAIDFEPDLPKTMLIEHQLQQVFMNVSINALDAMGGQGTLTVQGRRVDGAIEVAISDTGTGIRPEEMQHIFEPFFTTKAARKGTGLGLAMSYNIVQRHGGTIRVRSEEGKGSTFVISIPLREPNGDEHAPSQDSGGRR